MKCTSPLLRPQISMSPIWCTGLREMQLDNNCGFFQAWYFTPTIWTSAVRFPGTLLDFQPQCQGGGMVFGRQTVQHLVDFLSDDLQHTYHRTFFWTWCEVAALRVSFMAVSIPSSASTMAPMRSTWWQFHPVSPVISTISWCNLFHAPNKCISMVCGFVFSCLQYSKSWTFLFSPRSFWTNRIPAIPIRFGGHHGTPTFCCTSWLSSLCSFRATVGTERSSSCCTAASETGFGADFGALKLQLPQNDGFF